MKTNINPCDKSNMRESILSIPQQFTEGFKLAESIKIKSDFNKILISGMGGSALPGDILRSYFYDPLTKNPNYDKIEVHQNHFYKLPAIAYKQCLNIVCSYSGNTEETISSLQEALEKKLPIVGISAGGKIEEICLENNIPHIKLTKPSDNFQPRMALGYFVSVIIQLLINSGKIDSIHKNNILSSKENLTTDISQLEKQGKELAKKLVGKTPVIYSSEKFKCLALIWKIRFNENSKTPAFWNFFPELNHNEFVGFTNPQADYSVIMLKDSLDNPHNLKRYELTAKLLKTRNITSHIINIPEGETMYRIFSSLALSNWTSYYLAIEYETDPTPVEMVEHLKKELNELK